MMATSSVARESQEFMSSKQGYYLKAFGMCSAVFTLICSIVLVGSISAVRKSERLAANSDVCYSANCVQREVEYVLLSAVRAEVGRDPHFLDCYFTEVCLPGINSGAVCCCVGPDQQALEAAMLGCRKYECSHRGQPLHPTRGSTTTVERNN